ncbi:MAG: hypothetical protein KC766_37370, partial [Myxococcales bacterium]|nr:hypothetical protein [Myxococcales bacterium]
GKPLLDRVVYLDNAGGPATEVTIGSQKHSVKPGEVKKLELVGGTCEGALGVKRNGKAVAELPGKPTLRQNQAAPAVIDVTGKHCYALRKVIYVTSGNDAKHLKREAPRPLEEARIVEAPDVRYVLEPVPDTVKTPMAGALTHTALEHRSCR